MKAVAVYVPSCKSRMRSRSLLPLLVLVGAGRGQNPHHEATDYAAWLRQDDINGLKVELTT